MRTSRVVVLAEVFDDALRVLQDDVSEELAIPRLIVQDVPERPRWLLRAPSWMSNNHQALRVLPRAAERLSQAVGVEGGEALVEHDEGCSLE